MHRAWGKVFGWAILTAGTAATAMSICTLISPLVTHPKLLDREMIVTYFGWMMIFLSLFTMALAWYGMECIWLRGRRQAHRNPVTMGLILAVALSAVACIVRGWAAGVPLIAGVGLLGLITVGFFIRFIFKRSEERNDALIQHMRAMVGAGVSVYTAFFAFGAANTVPAIAFNPILWAAPTVVGVGVIIYQEMQLRRASGRGPRAHNGIVRVTNG